jgi:hypothetical protein
MPAIGPSRGKLYPSIARIRRGMAVVVVACCFFVDFRSLRGSCNCPFKHDLMFVLRIEGEMNAMARR